MPSKRQDLRQNVSRVNMDELFARHHFRGAFAVLVCYLAFDVVEVERCVDRAMCLIKILELLEL
jgi:hypothetical protein